MAGKGKRVHVTRDSQGSGWKVTPEKGRPITTTGTQGEAIQFTRDLLQNSPGGGELIIHRPDGTIREGRTINRNDPHPPKG